MYENEISTHEFLNTAFILMRKKVQAIKDLNSKSKKGKLPLPLLKQKFEKTSEILEALRLLISSLDFNKPESEEIASVYNTIGNRLSLANVDMDDEMYQNVIDIIESFYK